MEKGTKVMVINQSAGDFEAFIHRDNGIHETADVVLILPKDDQAEVTTMTFSYNDLVPL